MWNLKSKVNKPNKLIDTEKKLMVARWAGGWAAKGRGIKKYKLPVTKNSHRDVKYSIGNTVNNIVKTGYVPGGC